MDDKTLIHYGVLGMKWGVRKDGMPQGYQGSGNKSSRKRLNTGAKVAIGVGVTVAALGLAYGGYRLAKMNGLTLNVGKKAVDRVLFTGDRPAIAVTKKGTAVHSVVESATESLKKVNPTDNRENCPITSMTGLLRSHFSIDAVAKPCGSSGLKTPDMFSMMKECFPGCRTIPKTNDGAATAVNFGKSFGDAEAMLRKNFGDNAKGIVGFQWADGNGDGHVITWIMDNGKAKFYDYQTHIYKGINGSF